MGARAVPFGNNARRRSGGAEIAALASRNGNVGGDTTAIPPWSIGVISGVGLLIAAIIVLFVRYKLVNAGRIQVARASSAVDSPLLTDSQRMLGASSSSGLITTQRRASVLTENP